MPQFTHEGVEIAFLDQGEGEPIVLVHGFASNKEVNWVNPAWIRTLNGAGRRAIALDNRGHGASAKLYDPAAYSSSIMAGDVRALLDHLGLPRADVMGYSMGARISVVLALAHPRRVRSVVSGGLGVRLVEEGGGFSSRQAEKIAECLEAQTASEVSDPTARQFRSFAEQTHSDLRALAACMRGSRQALSRETVAHLAMPLLVAVGSKDAVAGSPQELAAIVPGAQALVIPDRDHMLAVGDRVFKAGVLDFLNRRP